MNRKEFHIVVGQKLGLKPNTVAAYLSTHRFKAAAYEMKGHVQCPRFSFNQIQTAVDLIKNEREKK